MAAISNSKPEPIEDYEEKRPTIGHKLAHGAHKENDDAESEHTNIEQGDSGWNEEEGNVLQPLISGWSNNELWTLIRRFNKQMFHVKAVQSSPVCFCSPYVPDNQCLANNMSIVEWPGP